MTQKIAVNLISGQLGSGKTTLIKQLLSQKPANENWALLVNEFGAIGIDGAILSAQTDSVQVAELPGGCICCTAENELENRLLALAQNGTTQRILIEPTGLSEPSRLIDILLSPKLHPYLEVQTLVSVFDVAHSKINDLKQMSILQSLLTLSDIILLNKSDLADTTKLQQIEHYCNQLYPPKRAVRVTTQAKLPVSELFHPHFTHSAFMPAAPTAHLQTPDAAQPETPPDSGVELPKLVSRRYQQYEQNLSIGWLFEPDLVFDWSAVFSLFQNLNASTSKTSATRAKGIFRVSEHARMLFQSASGEVQRELIAYRKDSRLELIMPSSIDFDVIQFEQQLKACIKS